VRSTDPWKIGSITLLFQRPSQPGLEILTTTTTITTSDNSPQQEQQQTWSPVPIIPDGYIPEATNLPPILLNIGDLLSYWTNGLLKSTVHRVIFPQEAPSPSSSSSSSPSSSIEPSNTNGEDPVTGNGEGKEVGAQGAVGVLGKDRYSIAYFCHPTESSPLEPVPSKLIPDTTIASNGGGEGKGPGQLKVGYGGGADGARVLTANEHLVKRLEATYGFAHQ
jgi:hypothetical protein